MSDCSTSAFEPRMRTREASGDSGHGPRCGFCGRTLEQVHAAGAALAVSNADESTRVCTACAREIADKFERSRWPWYEGDGR